MNVRTATDTIQEWRLRARELAAESQQLLAAARTYEAELDRKHPRVCNLDGLLYEEHDSWEADTDRHGPWVRQEQARESVLPDE